MEFTLYALDFWIIAIAIIGGCAASIVGCFLVLKRMSMLGDALSQAVLPGIILMFIVVQSRTSIWMLLGASIFGVIISLCIHYLQNHDTIDEGAALGVIFTAFFAVGLIMLVTLDNVGHIDIHTVIYGSLELSPLYVISIGPFMVPRAFIFHSIILLINTGVISLLFKEFNIFCFDPVLGTNLGISRRVMNIIMMFLVSLTSVALFETMGSVLVITMLVIPGSIAYLYTQRLISMVLLSCFWVVIGVIGGHIGAIIVPAFFGFSNTSSIGVMSIILWILFMGSLFCAPNGLLHSYSIRVRWKVATIIDDILGVLYRQEEEYQMRMVPVRIDVKFMKLLTPFVPFHMPRLLFMWTLFLLRYQQFITYSGHAMQLTDKGRERAYMALRTHRLWESYLFSSEVTRNITQLHGQAHILEHYTTTTISDILEESVHETYDPHGKPLAPHIDIHNEPMH